MASGNQQGTADLRDVRVFISYARGGLEHHWAVRLHEFLETLGADVWRDERDVRQGDDDWSRTIRDALRSSDALACIVGPATALCDWQTNELLDARDHAVPVVALRIDPLAKMPWHINQVQPVELGADADQALYRMAVELARQARRSPRALLGAEAPAAALAHVHAARQREITYLENLLFREFSEVAELYTEVQARPVRFRGLERSRRATVFRSDHALRRRQSMGESAEAEPYGDVLDAYRALKRQGAGVRRLAVLGEPGAGKTFSLQRIAVEYAHAALTDPAAPLPLFVELGGWTRNGQALAHYIDWRLETGLGGLRRDFERLRANGRAVLLLDGMNEVPPGQRAHKVAQIRNEAQDSRYASLLVSCRANDFLGDCALPFDEVRLLPLQPEQVRVAITQTLVRDAGGDVPAGTSGAETLFWRITSRREAAADSLREHYQRWMEAGLAKERFWTDADTPEDVVNDFKWSPGEYERKSMQRDPRVLLKLVGNPYLLTLLMAIWIEEGRLPDNRAELLRECLESLHKREASRRASMNQPCPELSAWRRALVDLAEALQRLDGAGGDAGARTVLARDDALWPSAWTDELTQFSIEASVVQRVGDGLRFTHQLLQESLSADALLEAARSGDRAASDFWPPARWWERSGWEVVAEIAAEACAGDEASVVGLICWLSWHQPGVAIDIWHHAGQPSLPADFLVRTAAHWCPRLTNDRLEPAPAARHAIGRWLGALDLDHRPGTGLRDGVPDIEWVTIDDDQPFVYQEELQHPALPAYRMARYPITNRQWQAFVEDGGYDTKAWWEGLAERPEPAASAWSEPSAPRETVSWYEAMAYCRWLTSRLELPPGHAVSLPTEAQWERAARGLEGRAFPWGSDWDSERANADFTFKRTTLVGLYPSGATPDTQMHDLAGQVWEWCVNEHENQKGLDPGETVRRVVRGGSWYDFSGSCRASFRSREPPGDRDYGLVGLRVVSGPIQSTVP